MSIYDFLCMPSLDKVTVREEPHGLDTSTLGRVTDRTTSPAPTGTTIPRASPKEITVTRPDCKVITKADHAAKQKAFTGPEISINVAKKTKSNKKGSGAEFAMEGIKSLNNVSQDKEVEAHAELSRGEPAPASDAQPLDAGTDEIASDGNVDPYYEARVDNTIGDVLERDLLPIVLRPYDILCPYDEGFGTETHRLRKLSLVELSDRMSYAQQTQTIKRQSANLKQHNESTVHANEEVSRSERDALVIKKEKIEKELVETKSQLEHRERQAEEIQGSIASFFQSDFTPLVRRFLKSGEFNLAFASMLNTTISVGVERGLRMDCSDDDSQSSLQGVARLEPDKVMPSHQTSSATTSLRANTHVRHSTSSSGTFGHTSTPEHLKKKKKFIEK
ncbi:hypothetical protein Tco_1462258 [Tanacetum coccineum]